MGDIFRQRRYHMVDGQLRTTDISDHAILNAFLEVPREIFVPDKFREIAYLDEDIRVSPPNTPSPRYVMEPAPLAHLVQLAKIGKDDIVLDVGCTTGYSSAILSYLAGSVIAIESDEEYVAAASNNLARLGCDNVAVVQAELTAGLPSEAPFDVILVNGAVDEIPSALFDQLKENGRLVTVVGTGNAAAGCSFHKIDGKISQHRALNLAVKPIPGFQKKPAFQF